ncbi:MAG: biosynthetic arginine decarboxylase [Bdellovibrionales bacterium]|nr:biosynthetic arginine decarboxylase [Bdellovibrionales bacterium]
MNWNYQKSAKLYGIDNWSSGYFRISESGNVEVTPYGVDGAKLDLFQLTQDLNDRGITPPILIRLPDVVKSRIELLSNCFLKAIKDYNYKGKYQGVFPIKVNQQNHLIKEIVDFGKVRHLGLECGSKPELLIALAFMDTPDALIICNGFKDVEYIETALLSQKLGRNTYIVIDRFEELNMVIQASKKLNIRPKIGFRAKLNAQGAGKWVESSGAKSKFGLTPSEIVAGIDILKKEDLLSSLELLHFHIGSQITSIHAIKSSLKEAVRYYTEFYALGAELKYLDVGGGLGVDYDGSGGLSDNSTNYDEQEYANDVISIIQSACEEKQIPVPNIVTEAGRALVAHSAILIFNIVGQNRVAKPQLDFEISDKDSRIVRELYDIYKDLTPKNLNECYNDLLEKKRDTMNMFSYGVLSLEQRAKAEDLYWAITTKMVKVAKETTDFQEMFWDLEKELSDTYYSNFSIFQSLPDCWALDQIFPVMPIHRLNENPNRRAILVDMTCDSDGKLERFIDAEAGGTQGYLEVHDLKQDEPYYIGVFLTGAYQETLGDLHNLFGDTNAVHVSILPNGENNYKISGVVEGDSVEEVLSYVEYNKPELIEKIRESSEKGIAEGRLTTQEAKLLMNYYQQALAGYTYLEEPED